MVHTSRSVITPRHMVLTVMSPHLTAKAGYIVFPSLSPLIHVPVQSATPRGRRGRAQSISPDLECGSLLHSHRNKQSPPPHSGIRTRHRTSHSGQSGSALVDQKKFVFHLAFVSRFIIDVSLILGEKSRDYSMISKLQPITYDQVVITYLSMEPVGSS